MGNKLFFIFLPVRQFTGERQKSLVKMKKVFYLGHE